MSAQTPAVMRLFFALWPDAAVRTALALWSEAMLTVCRGRRIPADKVHATLAFLGGQPAQKRGLLEKAAARVRSSAFELVLDQPGFWTHNRIAWLGASTVPPALITLCDALRAELSDSGFSFDPKPFVPHITLLRDASRPKELPVLAAARWPVADFSLVQSSGGRYTVLASWPLDQGVH